MHRHTDINQCYYIIYPIFVEHITAEHCRLQLTTNNQPLKSGHLFNERLDTLHVHLIGAYAAPTAVNML